MLASSGGVGGGSNDVTRSEACLQMVWVERDRETWICCTEVLGCTSKYMWKVQLMWLHCCVI